MANKKTQKSKGAQSNPTSAAKPAKAAAAKKDTAKAKKPAGAKKGAKAAAAENTAGGPSKWLADSVQFLREVQNELKKVVWPSRKQTISSTGVVIVLVVIVSAYLGIVDYILSRIVGYVIG